MAATETLGQFDPTMPALATPSVSVGRQRHQLAVCPILDCRAGTLVSQR
jgi:hypothetical protein